MFDQPGFFYWNSRLSASVVSRDVPKYFVNFVTENFNVPVSCLISKGKPLLAPTFKQIIRQQGVVSCDKTYASFRANLFKPSCWNAHGRMLQSWTTWDKVNFPTQAQKAMSNRRSQPGVSKALGSPWETAWESPSLFSPRLEIRGVGGWYTFSTNLNEYDILICTFFFLRTFQVVRTRERNCLCVSVWATGSCSSKRRLLWLVVIGDVADTVPS